MLDVRLCGCDCCTFTIKIVSFGIFALMDFLFILFLFFFSISYCPTTVSNYDFDSNSDLACLKCRGTQIRIYLYIDTDTDTYTDAKCEMHTPCTESKSNEKWIGCDTKSRLHLARYLALGCSVPVQAILLARSMVRGPWSIHGPLCIALLLSLLQFFFFSFFFLSSFLLFPSALECFKLSWA